MRTYNTQHLHYCSVDLHARSLFVNVHRCGPPAEPKTNYADAAVPG